MIEFHRLILGDKVRNAAFERALKQAIRPGETTMADIGSGTGFLAFLAARLGAKECHLYELSDMLGLSKKIAALNGIGNCRFVQRHSAEVRNPPKVDVVVSETLGNYALEENILETLADARRFLKPGGIVIPQALEQFVAPISSPRLYRELNVWDDLGHGLDFAPAREGCFHNIYVRTVRADDLLEQPDAVRTWDSLDFREADSSIRQSRQRWQMEADATIYGFAVWWSCTLLPGITLATAPDAPATHWEQIYLPVQRPLALKAGQTLELFLHSDSRPEVKIRIKWEAASYDGKNLLEKQGMDMRKGQI